MNQREVNEAVAKATGESVETISGMGFSLLMVPKPPVIVDHRVRLRQRSRRRLKAHETPARKPRLATPPVKTSGSVPTRRTAA